MKTTRRTFLTKAGASAAGLLIAPYLNPSRLFASGRAVAGSSLTQVALTRASSYDRTLVKQRVQHLFESLGGIGDLISAGKKVAIKLNLTGGSYWANDSKLGGLPITESMWTHPEVVRAVGELILDSGVSGSNIYIVEALGDIGSFNNFGYLTIQTSLGAQLIDLNYKAPYAAFVQKAVGVNKFYYDSFTVNQILADVDVYVSIPKMKEHYEAGVTASLKNQVGMVPKSLYTLPTDNGRRGALHGQGGPSTTHLPRSVCDLNLARPVHLTVIDGIKNARGGEGAWNPGFRLAADNVLIAGKEPVAADSIAAYLMGHNPEAATIALPAGGACDNYLSLLHGKGVGTNQMAEIQPVGDGADLVTAVDRRPAVAGPAGYVLCQNFPNPFNPATVIRFSIPSPGKVTLKVFSVTGELVARLMDQNLLPGVREVQWIPDGIASGVYICELRAGEFVDRMKMVFQK